MNPIDLVMNFFKKGYKTSEFWLILVAGVYNAVIAAYDPSRSWQNQATALGFAAASAVYAIVRSNLKMKRLDVISSLGAALNTAANTVIDTDGDTPTDTNVDPPVTPGP